MHVTLLTSAYIVKDSSEVTIIIMIIIIHFIYRQLFTAVKDTLQEQVKNSYISNMIEIKDNTSSLNNQNIKQN